MKFRIKLYLMIFFAFMVHVCLTDAKAEQSVHIGTGETIIGNGLIQTVMRDVPEFQSVDIQGVFEMDILFGRPLKIMMTGDSNILEHVTAEVVNRNLSIRVRHSYRSETRIRIEIFMDQLYKISASGSNKITVSEFDGTRLDVDLKATDFLSISGKTELFKVFLKGTARIDAKDLKAEDVRIEAKGSAQAFIYVSGELDAFAKGAASIQYIGTPQTIQIKTAGAGKVTGL